MANDRKVLGVTLTADGTQEVEEAFRSLGAEGDAAAKRIKQAFESVNFKGDLTGIVKKELAGMGTAGEAAAQKINAALAKVGIGESVTARIVRLRQSFAQLGESFSLTRSGFSNISAGAEQMVAGVERAAKSVGILSVAIGGAVAAATLLAKSSANTAEQIQNQATAFGVSFENMQKLRNAISNVGGDEGLLERALTKFTAGLNGTNEAADAAADALAKLQKQQSEALQNADTQAKKDIVAASYRDKIAEATDKLQKAQAVFNDTQQSGLPGLVEYGQRLSTLGDTQKQLAQVTKDFGARGAVTLLNFFLQLNGEMDDTVAAANKIIPALDKIGQENLKLQDEAGDRLSTNFSNLALLIGSRIAPAFTAIFDTIREIIGTVGPALAEAFGGVANAVALQINLNKDQILDFAKGVTASAIQIARDISAAISGVGQGNWITRLKEDVTGTFEFIRATIQNVLIPAFKTFGSLLDPVAGILNKMFGTEFTGNSLAAVVLLGKVTGGFDILSGAIKATTGFGKVFLDWVLFAPAKITALIEVIKDFYKLATASSGALLPLIAANPEIALLVGAVAALGVAAAYLYLNQSDVNSATVEAKRVSDEYTQAVKQAADGTRESTAALLEKQEALLNNRREAVISAREEKAMADAEVARAQATLASLQNTRAKAAAEQALSAARNRQSAATSNLTAAENSLAASQKLVASGTKAQTKGMVETIRTVKATGDEVLKLKTINLYGPGGLIKSFEVLPQKVLDARTAAAKLRDSLEEPGDNKLLNEATAKAQNFISKIGELGDAMQQALVEMSAAASAQLQALADAIPAFFDGVPAALAGVFSGVGTSLAQAWQGAMNTIIAETRQMVASVTGIINSLRSTLNSLVAAIRSAQARASSTSSSSSSGYSGGGARGFSWGGPVRGPGTTTSDSIFARLSDREYVVRAAGVAKVPLAFLDALNSGRYDFAELLHRFLAQPLRFANGGLVQSPRLAFAGAPASRGAMLAPVTLVIGGEPFTGFRAAPDSIQRLDRAAKLQRLTSTGRPSMHDR